MKFFPHLASISRGLLGIVYYPIVTLICSILIIFFSALAWVFCWLGLYRPLMQLALTIPTLWARLLSFHMSLAGNEKWDIQKNMGILNPHQWYLLISNHSSWLDIPVILKAFHNHVPIIKFFMKKELLWSLPFAGLACWSLGYPFMRRHTASEIRKRPELKGIDIQTTKIACQKFKMFPTAIMNFVEGTRFTAEKHSRQVSPYKNLLKPKAGGIGMVVQELQKELSGILNVTIYYDNPRLNLWQFLCGNYKKIKVRYEVIPITADLIGNYYEDRIFRQHLQAWLNQVWWQKDKLLDELFYPKK